MTFDDAITAAEGLLPGRAAEDGQIDPRWQAIIAIGEFIDAEPESVWTFVRRWGAHEDADLRAAVATCLLEHLLQRHPTRFRPLAAAAAASDARFADTLRRCWTFKSAAAQSMADGTPVLSVSTLWTIVDAEPADAETILALQTLAYQSEARRYNDWTIPPLVETLASVREHIEQHVVLKALANDRLVGSVRGVVEADVCVVGRLIVHPDVQKRGLGAALLAAIEARHPAVSAFELFTGDRSQGNLRLYARHGYVVTHTTRVSPEVSLVFLRKPASRAEAT